MTTLFKKETIALILALLFHTCGAAGILFTPYSTWFINSTPVNMLLMALLLVYTQQPKNSSFLLFIITCLVTGFLVEAAGVNTGLLFGNYTYGKPLGLQLFNVPLVIGVNWFITIYCTGNIVFRFNEWLLAKFNTEMRPPVVVQFFSFVFDGAIIATIFDWVLEPVAVKLGYWQWMPANEIPVFNFICWFAISALLLAVFRLLKFDKHNQFAIHLFIIQLLFFLVLQTFL